MNKISSTAPAAAVEQLARARAPFFFFKKTRPAGRPTFAAMLVAAVCWQAGMAAVNTSNGLAPNNWAVAANCSPGPAAADSMYAPNGPDKPGTGPTLPSKGGRPGGPARPTIEENAHGAQLLLAGGGAAPVSFALFPDEKMQAASSVEMIAAMPVLVCGDAILDPTEGCDDGNTVSGDGCSSTCQVETGYCCMGTPSTCAPNAACLAVARTWTGATNTDWNTCTNWSPPCTPIATNNVTIPNVANKPVIGAGTAALANSVTILAGGQLTVNSGGSLTMSGAAEYDLINQGTVINNGTITTMVVGSKPEAAIYNDGSFTNNATGLLDLGYADTTGIWVQTGTFTNFGNIKLGAAGGSLGRTGIKNFATFNNSGCAARIDMYPTVSPTGGGIGNGGTFTNSGGIIERSTTTHSGSNITNNSGIVQNLNGGTINIFTNTGTLTTATGDIWTGCTSTDWATASNWLDGSVPTATDNATIPNVTNKPVIFAGTAAFAFSVEVQSSLTINAMGSLTINGSRTFFGSTAGLYNTGTVTNSGTLTLGNIAAVGQLGFRNDGGTVNNNMGGLISIDRSLFIGLYHQNSGIFNNAGTIAIGAAATVGATGLYSDATFNNNAGGQISIDRSSVSGLENYNAFTNAALITIGAAGSVGPDAIINDALGTFNNSTCSALIRIVSNSVINNSGTFTNAGGIIENASGNSSITSNSGIVQNLNGGTFNITTNTGTLTTTTGDIWTGCTSTDWATASNWLDGSVPLATDNVTIPNVANKPVIFAGTAAFAFSVEVQSSLAINAMGSLTINGSRTFFGSTAGLYNTGTITNSGTLTLGSTGAVGQLGFRNDGGTVNNNMGGLISIDRSLFTGLYHQNSGIFNNAGTIAIGAAATVGATGINSDAPFNNNAGGQVTIDRCSSIGIENYGAFTNAAAITIGAAGSVGPDAIINDALGTFNNSTCSALIRIVSNSVINNSGTFTNAGGIIENASGNSNITSNSGTVQNLNGGTFTITTNTGTLTTSTGDIWTGCTSTDWATASNWFDGSAPTAIDNVVIPDRANDPVIGAGTAALANSVEVQGSSFLTINATGSLTINGSRNFSGTTYAFYNDGTVNNNGTLDIGPTSSAGQIGLSNRNTFNNNAGGLVKINRTTSQAFWNPSGAATMVNAGTLAIGAIAAVTRGIVNQGAFTNVASGQVSIDNAPSYGMQNFVATGFLNYGALTIGAIGNVGGVAIHNIATPFDNNGCASSIKVLTNSTIVNTGIPTLTFNNAGLIVENASGNSNITSNSGIVQNLNGGTFTITTNTGILTTDPGPQDPCCTPPAPPTGASPQNLCNTGSLTLANLSVTGSNIQWYAASSGGSPLPITTPLVNGTTYHASQTIGCESLTRLPVLVNFIPLPGPPVGTSPQVFCSSQNPTIASLVAVGTDVKWYATATGGGQLPSNNPLADATHYFAEQTVGGCVSSSRLDVLVTINPTPGPPTGAMAQSFCGISNPTVASLAATGANIQWYAGPVGGAPLPVNTLLTTGTPYFATQTVNGCESGQPRMIVNVTLIAPLPPSGTSPQSFSAGINPTLANLVVNGSNIQWYANAMGGAALPMNTPLVHGTTYHASQTMMGCESPNRLAILANVFPVPPPPSVASPQTFQSGNNPTVADLSATGSNIQWSTSPGGPPLPPWMPLIPGLFYYATQTVNGVTSGSSSAVQALVQISPPAPTGFCFQIFCADNEPDVNDLVATGSNIKWYLTPTGGVPLIGLSPLVNGQTYYASQTVGGIESVQRFAVMVTVRQQVPGVVCIPGCGN